MHHLSWRDCRVGLQRALSAACERLWTAAARLLCSLTRDQRGGTAVFVAAAIVPLVGFMGLAVDTTRGYVVKSRLGSALDAAALAGGRVYASNRRDDDIRMYFKANFPDGFMNATTSPLVITPDDANKKLTVAGQATVPTTFMRVLGIDTMDVSTSTEIVLDSQNVEVSLVLDVTGSMAGQRIVDLRSAANELVDIVVQDQQAPFYSKVGLVPYSMAVNVGGYADQARGAIAAPTAITAATRTNPVVVSAPGHGFNNGDKVYITGAIGMTQINNDMTRLPTSATWPQFWVVANATANTFALTRSDATTANGTNWGTYNGGGAVHCTTAGCQYHTFRRFSDNNWTTHEISSCVTERTGVNAYTDATPSGAPLGRNYPPPGTYNPCLTPTIVPLSSNRTLLHTNINGLQAGGSTGGQIGVAWGWYLLSPNFGYLWPSASQPSAYGVQGTMKVAIIMTDGEYNSVYFNGVIARDATNGSGSNLYKINQDSHNGNSYNQAQQLCAAMKTAGIIIYTVGLDVIATPAAQDLVQQCATSPTHVYLPANGTELKQAFRDIAMKVSRLRLSK